MFYSFCVCICVTNNKRGIKYLQSVELAENENMHLSTKMSNNNENTAAQWQKPYPPGWIQVDDMLEMERG